MARIKPATQLSADAVTVNGAGARFSIGSGDADAQQANVAGAAARQLVGTGASASQSSAASGSGTVNPAGAVVTGTGAAAAQNAATASTALVSRTGAGSLQSQSAVVDGTDQQFIAPSWDATIGPVRPGVPFDLRAALLDPNDVHSNIRVLGLPADATYDDRTGILLCPTEATGLQPRAQYATVGTGGLTFAEIIADIQTRGAGLFQDGLLCNSNFPNAAHIEDHNFEVNNGRPFPSAVLQHISNDSPDGTGGCFEQTLRASDGTTSFADAEFNFCEDIGSGGSLTSRLQAKGVPTPMPYNDGGLNDLGGTFWMMISFKWSREMFDNQWVLSGYDGGWKIFKAVMGDWLDERDGNELRKENSAQVAEVTFQNLDYTRQLGCFLQNSSPYLLENYVGQGTPPLPAQFQAGLVQVDGFNVGPFAEIASNVSNVTGYTDSHGVQHAQRNDAATFTNQILTGGGGDHPYVRQPTQWGYSALNVNGSGSTGRSVVVNPGGGELWQPSHSQLLREGLSSAYPIEYDEHRILRPNEWMTVCARFDLGALSGDYHVDSRIRMSLAREGEALEFIHDSGAIYDIPNRVPTRYAPVGRWLVTPFSTNLLPSGAGGLTRDDATIRVGRIVTSLVPPRDPFNGNLVLP